MSNLECAFSIKRFPSRCFFMGLSLLLIIVYFLSGHVDNSNLTAQAGLVREFKSSIIKKAGIFRYSITLQGILDTVYWQDYYIDAASKYIWNINKNELIDLKHQIKENDTITFYYNAEENTLALKSGVIQRNTYGLYVNGKTIIDVSKRKYFTFGIGLLGTLFCLSLLITLFLFGLDYVTTLKNRRNKKIQK